MANGNGAGTGALLGMLREILSQIASPSSALDREMLDDMLVTAPLAADPHLFCHRT